MGAALLSVILTLTQIYIRLIHDAIAEQLILHQNNYISTSQPLNPAIPVQIGRSTDSLWGTVTTAPRLVVVTDWSWIVSWENLV